MLLEKAIEVLDSFPLFVGCGDQETLPVPGVMAEDSSIVRHDRGVVVVVLCSVNMERWVTVMGCGHAGVKFRADGKSDASGVAKC